MTDHPDLRQTSIDEAIARVSPTEQGSIPDSPASPGCYAIEIDVPAVTQDELAAQWLTHYDHTPPYLGAIADCDRTIYVGAARNVRGRLEDHLDSSVRVATLPRLWGISRLIDIWWYDSTQAAFEHEQRCADSLSRDHPDAYVHCR